MTTNSLNGENVKAIAQKCWEQVKDKNIPIHDVAEFIVKNLTKEFAIALVEIITTETNAGKESYKEFLNAMKTITTPLGGSIGNPTLSSEDKQWSYYLIEKAIDSVREMEKKRQEEEGKNKRTGMLVAGVLFMAAIGAVAYIIKNKDNK